VLTRLGDLLEVQNGFAFDSKGFSPISGTPLIRIRDLRRGVSNETRYDGDFDTKYLVHAGDLLIGMDGEFACYEWRGEPALLNQRVCRLQGFKSELLPRYLYYAINKHLKEIEDRTGYATVKHLSSKSVLSITMAVPPLTEQQRIVGMLDKAFAAISLASDATQQNVASAKELFESKLEAVFASRPVDSNSVSLGTVATFRNGINYTKSSRGQSVMVVGVRDFQDHFWVPVSNLEVVTIDGALDPADTLCQGDILVVRSNGSADLVGRCMLVGDKPAETTHSGFTIRVRLSGRLLSPEYVCYFLKSRASRRKLSNAGTGTGIRSLSQAALSPLVMPVPAVSEQADLVAQLHALRDETQALQINYQRRLASLDSLKQSMLHHAFANTI
jgi:type I restriction enzyme S subunit